MEAGEVASHILYLEMGLVRSYSIIVKAKRSKKTNKVKKQKAEVSNWFMREGNIIISVQSFLRQTPGIRFDPGTGRLRLLGNHARRAGNDLSGIPGIRARRAADHQHLLLSERGPASFAADAGPGKQVPVSPEYGAGPAGTSAAKIHVLLSRGEPTDFSQHARKVS